YTSNEVYAVEISKAFRRQLRALKLAKNVSIIKNDARNLKNEISDNTIDKLLGVNLVYFLKPLNIYVDEFFRILKPGGVGLFACKFDKIQEFDDTVAPNKSEAQVITALVDAGFETTSEYIDLGDANSRFTAIKFCKPLD
ncbi:MAG: methyltransferase domain-containing protein, partial [Rhodobacterales bacterium]|nr:methyltransferase domain-containing protein [Rhodobacterales bacterium]